MTEPQPLQQVERTYVRLGSRTLSYFSGCDYFRLASHPKVIAGLQRGVEQFGLNVAASRLTTGNHRLYGELEQAVAAFFKAPSALLVSTGYVTNLIAAQALAGSFSHALLDENSHPALANAARFLDCPLLQFKHRDAADLARSVRRCGPQAKLLVLTDGMFSRDGAAAPLKEYLKVLPADGQILVDDAHGAGVLGRTGRGALEEAGVSRGRIIQTLTLSKAFGAYGGVILGPKELRQRILERSGMFVGSTPLPLPLANAAIQGVKLLEKGQGLRARLARNASYVKDALRARGFCLPQHPGPIIPLLPRQAGVAQRLRRALLAAEIFPPFLRYPGGPPNGYFRFVVCSEHSRGQLDALLEALKTISPEQVASDSAHCH